MPSTCASGHLAASDAVSWPGPQPRSTTEPGDAARCGPRVEERPRALVGEAQVLGGIPHVTPSRLTLISLDIKISHPVLPHAKSRCQEI